MRSRRAIAALGIFLGTRLASAADPTNDEQYFLEITNRMRLNPQAELLILANINKGPPATWASPKSDEFQTANALTFFNVDASVLQTQWNALVPAPPIAWNSKLHDAAFYHANRVIAHRFDPPGPNGESGPQRHEFPGEPTIGQRFNNAGYTGWNTGAENLYAFAHNNFHGHAGFAIDWGNGPGGIQSPAGHRNNIMNPAFRETGVAIVPFNEIVGPLIINMDYASRPGFTFLTGVIYNDTFDANHFYTPGEGVEDVTIEVFNAGTNTLRSSTSTWSSGGYSLQLAVGTYDVKISGTGIAGPITYRNVVMASSNVKIDSLTSWLPAGGGSWTSAANWNGGVPNGVGTRAFVSSYSGSGGAIPINSAITVGSIDIDSSGFALNGTGSISLDVATGQSRINVAGTNHSIAVPLILNDNTTINVAGDLAIIGGLQNPSAKILMRAGAGNLRIAGPQNHAPGSILTHNAGTTRLGSNAGTPASPAAAAAGKLAIDITGTNSRLILESDQDLSNLTIAHASAGIQSLDLAGHALRVYSPNLASAKSSLYSAMRNVLVTPFDGILDSTLSSHVNARVGLAVVPDAHGDSHLLIRPTRAGDINLDGTVTIADFLGLAGNFNSSGVTWQEGDLNLDGNVTIADFLELAGNFNTSYSGETFPISDFEQQLLSTFAASIGASVPEPSAISALALGAMLLTSRRRRR
jgi:uncharacterized protein YkwD